MNNIDNSNLLGYNKNFDYSAFQPKLTFAYNAGAKTVTVTDASTFAATDAFKHVNVTVHDKFGGQVFGEIAAAAGNTGALNVAGLNPSKGLVITGTVVSENGHTATGSYHNIPAAGDLTDWNKMESAAEAID